jgi:hypothetical protein
MLLHTAVYATLVSTSGSAAQASIRVAFGALALTGSVDTTRTAVPGASRTRRTAA